MMIPITTDNPRSLRTQILISSSIDKLNFRLDSGEGRETFENFLTTHDSDAPSTNQTPTPPPTRVDEEASAGCGGKLPGPLRLPTLFPACHPAGVARRVESGKPASPSGSSSQCFSRAVAVRLRLYGLAPAARAVSKALSRAEAEAGHARARIDSAAWRPTRTSYKVLVIRIIL
jgi:hypothetical protein